MTDKKTLKKTLPFWICLIAAIGLLVTGFFMPPIGIIDNSVITATGLLLIFAVLGQLPIIIEVAARNYRLKNMGYDASQELIDRSIGR